MKKEPVLPQPANTVVWDIETTNLSANYGIILCAVIKPLRLPAKTFRLDDFKDGVRNEDRELIRAVIKEIDKYEFVVSYNGRGFDTKYLWTRAMYHGIHPPEEKLQIDLLQITRRYFRTNNRRLDTIVNFLDLEEKKTQIDPKYWRWAMLGDRNAMNYVVKHCYQDVLTLELVYERLREYVKGVKRA